MNEQRGFYWKKVRISLFRLTTLYTQKQQDLKIVALEYNPTCEKCQLCDHDPIKNVFILQNIKTKEELRIGSECAVNYTDEKLLLQASGLLRKEIFVEKYAETVKKINSYPYKTKTMQTFLHNIEQGNYPWAALVTRLRHEFSEIQPTSHQKIEAFIEEFPTRWISKEIQKELAQGAYPSQWKLKEMKKILDKNQKEEPKPEPKPVLPKKLPTREELKHMTLQEKLALL